MKYADVSAALCWVIQRPLTPKALRLRVDYRKGVHRLLAPSVFSAEAASALTKRERQELIPVGQARWLHPYDPLLYRATDIPSQTRAGLYECLYVALVERKGYRLVAADHKTPILRSTNAAIGNTAPHVYVGDARVVGDAPIGPTLQEHLIDEGLVRTPFTAEVFKKFLEDRTNKILAAVAQVVEVAPVAEQG